MRVTFVMIICTSDVIIAVGDGKTKRNKAELLSVNGNKWNKVDSYPFLVNGIDTQILFFKDMPVVVFLGSRDLKLTE